MGTNLKHRCTVSEESTMATGMYGNAIDTCEEDEKGRLFVDNGEYQNQVNYCPFCGFKAPVQIAQL